MRATLSIALIVTARALVAQAPVTRDSSGIHIVSNTAPLWTAQTARRLETKPTLALGSGGAPEEEFGKVLDAVRLSDGSVVVADAKNLELRVFNAAGKFVRKIGRKGEGPGDFGGPSPVFRLAGDTLLTWDIRLHRLTWFNVDGKVAKTLLVTKPPITTFPNGQRMGSLIFVFGTLQDGSFLGYVRPGRMNPPTEMHSDSAYVMHVLADGKYTPLSTLFFGESYNYHSSDDKFVSFDDRPFTTKSSFVAGAGTLWYTDGVHFELREYSTARKVLKVIRLRRTPAPVTTKDIAAFNTAEIEALKRERIVDESSRQTLIDLQKEIQKWMSVPKTMPAYTALKVESNGNIWARQYGDTTKVQHWDSFDRTGRYLGVVDTPAGFEVFEFGADYVLGRVRDQDDVEGVRVYRFAH